MLWYIVQAGRFRADEGIGPKCIVTPLACDSGYREESLFCHVLRKRSFVALRITVKVNVNLKY